MKLIPRYLLSNFLRPWLYILSGFTAIAVLVDLFDNVVAFMGAGTSFVFMILYYAASILKYFPYLLPVSILLALLYALWRLGKNSEITAMRACGLSLGQLSLPYLAFGLACALFLLAVNERIAPRAARWARTFREVQEARAKAKDGKEADDLVKEFAFKNETARRDWIINTFDIRPESDYEMRNVLLTQQRPNGKDEYRIYADRARWINGHWWFERLEIHRYNDLSHPVGAPEKHAAMDMTMLTETPEDFLLNTTKKSNEEEFSAADIRAFIREHPGISEHELACRRVNWNSRLATPWLCVIVVLVGIPFGMKTGRNGMGKGILAALLIFFGYWIMMGVCRAFGQNASLYGEVNTWNYPMLAAWWLSVRSVLVPVLAAWAPPFCFLVIGLFMFRRCR